MTRIGWSDFDPNMPTGPGRRRAQLRLILEATVGALILLLAFYALAVYGAALS